MAVLFGAVFHPLRYIFFRRLVAAVTKWRVFRLLAGTDRVAAVNAIGAVSRPLQRRHARSLVGAITPRLVFAKTTSTPVLRLSFLHISHEAGLPDRKSVV